MGYNAFPPKADSECPLKISSGKQGPIETAHQGLEPT